MPCLLDVAFSVPLSGHIPGETEEETRSWLILDVSYNVILDNVKD